MSHNPPDTDTAHGSAGRYQCPWHDLFRYHLERTGMANEELAERLGCGSSTIAHYRTARIRPPTDDKLGGIVQALHLDGNEADRFIEEAWLGNAPAQVVAMVQRLKRELREARANARAPSGTRGNGG